MDVNTHIDLTPVILLQGVFIALKLCHVIDWEWVFIFMPIYIWGIGMILGLVFIFFVWMVAERKG